MFTERTQVLLSTEQRRRLERQATEEHRSVGSVIRDAVDAYTRTSSRSRREAAERLLASRAPVDDWPVMKAEVLRGSMSSGG